MLPVPRVRNIRVDGDLHKAPWTQLAPIWLAPSATVARRTDSSRRRCASVPTASAFVAFDCEDVAIVATPTGRNAPIYREDVVEAFLAPSADRAATSSLETSRAAPGSGARRVPAAARRCASTATGCAPASSTPCALGRTR
jgi:hypothetical protein